MAGRGNAVTFHGAFGTKAGAQAKERRTPGSYIQERTIRGRRRFLVLTRGAAPRKRAARSRRKNPASILVVGPNRGALVSKRVEYIEYEHLTEGPRWHEFRPGVRMELLPDGSVRLYHPTLRLWMDDGE